MESGIILLSYSLIFTVRNRINKIILEKRCHKILCVGGSAVIHIWSIEGKAEKKNKKKQVFTVTRPSSLKPDCKLFFPNFPKHIEK